MISPNALVLITQHAGMMPGKITKGNEAQDS